MSKTSQYERITAEDVQVGDLIARAKTHPFSEVVAISEGAVARRFALVSTEDQHWPANNFNPNGSTTPAGSDLGNIRPRRTAKLWRQVQV